MKKFVFPLESVLKAKEAMDRQKMSELAVLSDKMRQTVSEIAYIGTRRKHACNVYSRQAETGIRPKQAENYYLNLAVLRESEKQKEALLAKYRKEEAEIRLQLLEIRRDKKMLELLRDKKYQDYLKEIQSEQEKMIDELVSFKEAAQSREEAE